MTLTEIETNIEVCLETKARTDLELGKYFRMIKEGRMYGKGTFAGYLSRRWDMTLNHIRQLIEAYNTQERYEAQLRGTNLTRHQLLELAKIPQEDTAIKVIQTLKTKARKNAKDIKFDDLREEVQKELGITKMQPVPMPQEEPTEEQEKEQEEYYSNVETLRPNVRKAFAVWEETWGHYMGHKKFKKVLMEEVMELPDQD